jgi:hypothetical protein
MRVLLGAVIGFVLMWLYRSKRVREEAERRLATVPEPVRHAATAARAASAGQIERVAQAVDAAPVPETMKDALGRATAAARSTAEKLGGTPMAGQAATLSIRELPDSSWIGDAAWGGRTLSDEAPDPEVLIRRLATSMAAMPEAGPPQRVTLTRVPWNGPREEREVELSTVLG